MLKVWFSEGPKTRLMILFSIQKRIVFEPMIIHFQVLNLFLGEGQSNLVVRMLLMDGTLEESSKYNSRSGRTLLRLSLKLCLIQRCSTFHSGKISRRGATLLPRLRIIQGA